MDSSESSSSAPTSLLERMKQRTDNLAQRAEQRRQEKENQVASSESVDFFHRTFQEMRSALEAKLEEAGKVENAEIASFLDSMVKDVQEMQKVLNESNMFLASFQIKTAQEELRVLNVQVCDKIDELQPKKKFGFGKKPAPEKRVDPREAKKDQTDGNNKNVSSSNTLDYLLLEREFFGFKDETGKTLTMSPDKLENRQLNLHNLRDCRVVALGNLSTLQVSSLHNCTVIIGPTSRSSFIKDSTNCKFVIACQQVRMHNTSNSQFYLHVTGAAIIENCREVQFAPYNLEYPELTGHYQQSGLDQNTNRWDKIDDFHWLNEKEDSPNWSVLPEAERLSDWLQ